MAASDQPPVAPLAEADSLKTRLRYAALVGLVALTLNLAGNSRTSLWDRDEPRYATCTREMRARGDFIRPSFNGEPRYQKPVLIYWLMLIGTSLGGDNPFGVRLASVFAGTGTCLLTWGLGRRMFGPKVGLMAALMLATAPIMVAESKLATTDATLAFFVVACQFALWQLGQRESRTAAALFWIVLALAMLTKGPVGPALIAAAGLFSWWWCGPSACWRRLEWQRGLALFALIAAPWFIAIGIVSHGQFFHVALGTQIVRRIARGVEEHGGFPGYYVVTSLLTFHPWFALLPAALVGAWVKRRGEPALGFLMGWVIGPLVLLECVRTKLVHYYLPAFPACALLAAWLVDRVQASELNLRRWPLGRLSLGLCTGVGIGLTVALLAGVMVFPWSLRWPCLAMATLLAAGTLVAMERFHGAGTERAVRVLIATWGGVMFLVGAWLLPAAEPYRVSRIVGERIAALVRSERATPMLVSFQQPSVVYAIGRPAPTMQDRQSFFDRVRRDGAVVTALTTDELATLRRDPRGAVELKEVVHGFNIDKGRTETLNIVIVRLAAPSAVAGRSKQVRVE